MMGLKPNGEVQHSMGNALCFVVAISELSDLVNAVGRRTLVRFNLSKTVVCLLEIALRQTRQIASGSASTRGSSGAHFERKRAASSYRQS